jgi:hypothetical protein
MCIARVSFPGDIGGEDGWLSSLITKALSEYLEAKNPSEAFDVSVIDR